MLEEIGDASGKEEMRAMVVNYFRPLPEERRNVNKQDIFILRPCGDEAVTSILSGCY